MLELTIQNRLWRCSFLALTSLTLIGGCANYQAKPLPEQAMLVKTLEILAAKAYQPRNTETARHKINLTDGLDLTEVAILAVLGNLDLKVQRRQLGVADAQVFAVGLLPDPQLSANLDHPTGDTPGLTNAWGLGMGYNITQLITRQARVNTKRSVQTKVQLELLWQEWQVIQQARVLAVRLQLENMRLSLLHTVRDLYQDRYQHSAKGLKEGDVTLDVNGTDLTALVDSLSQITQLEQQHNQTRHDLNHLLGLAPGAIISLTKLPIEPTLNRTNIQAQLRKLPEIRPDLLALQAGYQAQEARVRGAILAQFPSLSIGISRDRDTGSVYSRGFNISLNLPLFSGNRGAIAIERATRKQLSQAYQARLAQTETDVSRLLELHRLIEEQRGNLQIYLPRLKALVERARRAYRQGDIDALTFLNMESAWVNKRLEKITLQQTQWESRIALQTLLALPDARFTSGNSSAIKNTQP